MGNREIGIRPLVPSIYDDLNQLLSTRQFTYQYDISGNLTAKSPVPPVTADGDTETETGFTYEWNDENQLTKVVRTTSKQVISTSFHYDPFGRRVEKRVEITNILTARTSVKIHTYLYDQEDIVQEIITKPRPRRDIVETTSFVHGPGIDEPLAFSGPQGEYFFHADGLGSISALTDHTGAVVQRYEYSTFGTRKKYDTGADTFYSYTGREWDSETGLYYYRARYYDPQAGRFISRDPIGFAGGDVNVYRYVGNGPVNAVDPWGLVALFFDRGGNTLTTIPSRSGVSPYSIPVTSGNPNSAPLPAGPYAIDIVNLSNPSFIHDLVRQLYGDWGDWRVPLIPQFNTNRSGFFIHGGSLLGSGGCIDIGGGILGNENTDRLLNDLLNESNNTLNVFDSGVLDAFYGY